MPSSVTPTHNLVCSHLWSLDVCFLFQYSIRELMRFDHKTFSLLRLRTFSVFDRLLWGKTRILIWFMNSFYLVEGKVFLQLVRSRRKLMKHAVNLRINLVAVIGTWSFLSSRWRRQENFYLSTHDFLYGITQCFVCFWLSCLLLRFGSFGRESAWCV